MTGYAPFRQIQIRYSDTGRGRVIVLLHGFPETMEIWDEFSVKLARHFRIIAIDLPGHGETPPIGYQHSMELMAEAVKAVMNHLHLRRYVLVGHSMGGYVALAFAELYHDQLSGLCLFHSTPYSDSTEKKADRLKAIALVKEDTRHYVNDVVTGLFAPHNRPLFKEDIRELKHIAQGISRQGIVNALHGMKDRPKRDWVLQYSDYPVLYILGKHDSIVPFDLVMEQTKQVKDAEVLVLEQAGHMGFIEEKNKCQDALLKFARRCFRA
ncbi:MAG: alpha/beta fold hydrolase [Bacteroidia bacterium]